MLKGPRGHPGYFASDAPSAKIGVTERLRASMTAIVEVNESGELSLPADVVGPLPARTRFTVRREGETIIVEPEDAQAARRARAAERLLKMTESLPPSEEPPLEEINQEIDQYRRERVRGADRA